MRCDPISTTPSKDLEEVSLSAPTKSGIGAVHSHAYIQCNLSKPNTLRTEENV